jgi:hypothetical protein
LGPLVLARTLQALETLRTAVERRLWTAPAARTTELKYQPLLQELVSTGFLDGRT